MTPLDCLHENDVTACISVRRTGPPARCMNCKAGRVNEEKARDLGQSDPPAARPRLSAWRNLGRLEKEAKSHEEVNRMDGSKKDFILRKIQEHKAITRGALAGNSRLRKKELEPIIESLDKEGKIKVWPGKRSDSMIYTTPDLPNPLEWIDGKKPAAKKATPRAAGPLVPMKSQAIPRKPSSTQAAGSSPPKNGGGRTDRDDVLSQALTELRQRRESIDRAITALEEMTA